MKHAVLDKPYVRFGQMCKDIDEWLVHAGTGHRKVSLQGGIGREPAHCAGDRAHAVPRCRVIRRRFPTDPPVRPAAGKWRLLWTRFRNYWRSFMANWVFLLTNFFPGMDVIMFSCL